MRHPDSAAMACPRERDLSGQASAFIAHCLQLAQVLLPRTTLRALVLIGFACSPAAHADTPDLASLEREVVTLTAIVQRLQTRVERLEREASAAEQPASGVSRPAPSLALQPPAQVDSHAVQKPASPTAPIAAGAVDTSPQTQLRINWSKIAPGMTAAQVLSLLGEPTRRMTLDGRSVWYYIYPALGNASVFFSAAGQVSSHQSPFPWG